jgi:hypothetical protein
MQILKIIMKNAEKWQVKKGSLDKNYIFWGYIMVPHTGIFGRVRILSVKIAHFFRNAYSHNATRYPQKGFLQNFVLRGFTKPVWCVPVFLKIG